PDEVRDGRVTASGRTVIDCAKTMPFDEALAVADSAIRHRDMSKTRLCELAEQVPSIGRAACLRVAAEADGRAANPFESVLRAIALDVPGLDLVPQVAIGDGGLVVQPDLVDVRRGIVLEADSFEFHGRRKALKRDCERYNALVCRGWIVLRFAWEHVMFEPDYVAAALRAVSVARPRRRATLAADDRKSA
ncbi:MAG: endonuclease domain-containing protein, partial [Nocardioidaceae bacterium]